jgi:hypothetical protein
MPVLQQELAWALQRQNRRFADALRRRNLPAKWRQRGAIAISLVALGVLGRLIATSPPAYRRAHLLLFVSGTVFFLATLALGIVFPRYQAWERRFADGLLARRAERMLEPLAARAPFTRTYELDDVLRTAAKLVVSTPGAVMLFDRADSLTPARIVPVPDEAVRDAVVASLVAAGAAHAHAAGAADGDLAPTPEALVR